MTERQLKMSEEKECRIKRNLERKSYTINTVCKPLILQETNLNSKEDENNVFPMDLTVKSVEQTSSIL